MKEIILRCKIVGVLLLALSMLNGCNAKRILNIEDLQQELPTYSLTLNEGYQVFIEREDTKDLYYRIYLQETESGVFVQEYTILFPETPKELRAEDFTTGYYKEDLVVLFSGEQTAYLFLWDNTKEQLIEKPVEIPADYQHDFNCGIYRFKTIREKGKETEKIIYSIGLDDTKEVIPIRKYTFSQESGAVSIYDYLHNKILFEGITALKEDGAPQNEKYYSFLFEDQIPYYIFDDEEENMFTVYICGSEEFKTKEYDDNYELLEDQCFAQEEPFYCYMDALGDLELELYFNTETKHGCGVWYIHRFNTKMEKRMQKYGVVFQGVTYQEWDFDPYRLESIDGGCGKNFGLEGYKETYQYRTDGKLDNFLSQGMMTHEGEKVLDNLLKMDFYYREDGSLAYREYHHNPWIWGSTDQTVSSYFDEQERVIYEHCYITHGGIDRYYIYDDNTNIPKYCFSLDNGGYYGAEMIVYK